MKQIIFYPLRYKPCIITPYGKGKVNTITATYCGGGFPPGYNLRPTVLEIYER